MRFLYLKIVITGNITVKISNTNKDHEAYTNVGGLFGVYTPIALKMYAEVSLLKFAKGTNNIANISNAIRNK